MKIELRNVSKGGALPSTTVRFETGRATLANAETEQRPTVLGLIASGRMRPESGSVTIDGATDYGAMRRRIALIDAPEVSDPAPDVTVAGVTAEELMFAGRRSHPLAVRATLNELGLTEYSRRGIGTMPPDARVRLMVELALLRRGVEGIVLTSPDRHGGDPNGWWAIAREIASRGIAVLVIAGDASAAAIGASGIVERLAAEAADDELTPRHGAESADVDAADPAPADPEPDVPDPAPADPDLADPARDIHSRPSNPEADHA